MGHRQLLVMLLCLALTACSLGTDLSVPATSTDTGRGDSDADPGDTPDGPDVPGDTQIPDLPTDECEDGDVTGCPILQGAYVTDCVDGRCIYLCDDFAADSNGDLALGTAGNGCECQGIEEICDGDDNDCDGEIDESFPGAQACPGEGICQGAQTSCGFPGCSVDLYESYTGGAYTHKLDGVCDGVDSDCDGVDDEDCCEDGSNGYLFDVARRDNRNRQVRPTLAVSPVGDTAVAWEETNSATLGTFDPQDARIRLRVFGPALTDITSTITVTPEFQTTTFWPKLAHDGVDFYLVYLESGVSQMDLKEARLMPGQGPVDTRTITTVPLQRIHAPAFAAHAGVRLVAWANAHPSQCSDLHQACIEVSATVGEQNFQQVLGGGDVVGPPAVASRDGRSIVVWSASMDGSTQLRWRTFAGSAPANSGSRSMGATVSPSDLHPDVTATPNGWAIAHQARDTPDNAVLILTLLDEQGAILGGGGTLPVTDGGDDLKDLQNVAIAAANRGAVLFHDGRQALSFLPFNADGLEVGVAQSQTSFGAIDTYGLALATDPRTELIGAVSRDIDTEGGLRSDVYLFWVNNDGSTLCR